jgi:ATP-dependent DNA ligase
MRRITNSIVHGDGEGVILRQPLSVYEQGATSLLVKHKV